MDVARLTMGEIAKVEELAGMGIGAMDDPTAPKGKLMAALAFVVKKRQDKDFTFAQALDLDMGDLEELLGNDDPKAQD